MSGTPSAQYRITIRIRIDDEPGTLGLLTGAIGRAGGIIDAVDPVEVDDASSVRDIVVDGSGREHWQRALDIYTSLGVPEAAQMTTIIAEPAPVPGDKSRG